LASFRVPPNWKTSNCCSNKLDPLKSTQSENLIGSSLQLCIIIGIYKSLFVTGAATQTQTYTHAQGQSNRDKKIFKYDIKNKSIQNTVDPQKVT